MIKKLFFILLVLINVNRNKPTNFAIQNIDTKPLYLILGSKVKDPLLIEDAIKINPKDTFKTDIDMTEYPEFIIAPFKPVTGDKVHIITLKDVFGLPHEEYQKLLVENRELAEEQRKEELRKINIFLSIRFEARFTEKSETFYYYNKKRYNPDQLTELKQDVYQLDAAQLTELITETIITKNNFPIIVTPKFWFTKNISKEELEEFTAIKPICYDCIAMHIIAHMHGINQIFDDSEKDYAILGITQAQKDNALNAYHGIKDQISYLANLPDQFYKKLYQTIMIIIQDAYEKISNTKLPLTEKEILKIKPLETKEIATQTTEPAPLVRQSKSVGTGQISQQGEQGSVQSYELRTWRERALSRPPPLPPRDREEALKRAAAPTPPEQPISKK